MPLYQAAREPAFNEEFDDELCVYVRYKDVKSMDEQQINEELRFYLDEMKSPELLQLLRRLEHQCFEPGGQWTRSMEKQWKAFMAELLCDGEPKDALVYRVRQLAVAYEAIETTDASVALVAHHLLSHVCYWPRFHARFGLW